MPNQIQDLPNAFAKLPALAERLGVKPHEPGGPPTWLISSDGVSYDVFDLVNAFLDRADAIDAQLRPVPYEQAAVTFDRELTISERLALVEHAVAADGSMMSGLREINDRLSGQVEALQALDVRLTGIEPARSD